MELTKGEELAVMGIKRQLVLVGMEDKLGVYPFCSDTTCRVNMLLPFFTPTPLDRNSSARLLGSWDQWTF